MSSDSHTCAVACTHLCMHTTTTTIAMSYNFRNISKHLMESYENQKQRKYVKWGSHASNSTSWVTSYGIGWGLKKENCCCAGLLNFCNHFCGFCGLFPEVLDFFEGNLFPWLYFEDFSLLFTLIISKFWVWIGAFDPFWTDSVQGER